MPGQTPLCSSWCSCAQQRRPSPGANGFLRKVRNLHLNSYSLAQFDRSTLPLDWEDVIKLLADAIHKGSCMPQLEPKEYKG